MPMHEYTELRIKADSQILKKQTVFSVTIKQKNPKLRKFSYFPGTVVKFEAKTT